MIEIMVGTFLSSLGGSFHCLGMCGPITFLFPAKKKYLLSYHFFRLLGYLTLTALTYSLGRSFLSELQLSTFRHYTLVIFGGFFISLGAMQILKFKWQLGFLKPIDKFKHRLLSLLKLKSPMALTLFLGFFSFTLPCGWLYAFIFGSLTLPNISSALLIIFSFWLGTVPLLVVTPSLGKKLKDKIAHFPAILMLIIGVLLVTQAYLTQ